MKAPEIRPSFGQNITMIMAVLSIVFLFFLIVVGDKGITDLQKMKAERLALLNTQEEIKQKNLQIHHEIERIKTDPAFIETIARQDLGLVGKKEIVINMSNLPAGK